MTTPVLSRTRRLTLATPADADTLAHAAGLEGVLALDAKGCRLRITYDRNRHSFPTLVHQLTSLGLRPREGLLARLALAWAGFQDDNRRDQSRLVHHCCNAPPKS